MALSFLDVVGSFAQGVQESGAEVDKEIAESDYCETVGDLPIRNIYLDEEIICPDQQQGGPLNIYQSQVNPEDLEDCD